MFFFNLQLYAKGMLLFMEVESSLKKIGSRLMGSKLNIQGSLKEFSVILEMLKREHAAFEVSLSVLIYGILALRNFIACFFLCLEVLQKNVLHTARPTFDLNIHQ